MASFQRRQMLTFAAAAGLAACRPRATMTASHTPALDMERLNREVGAIAQRLAPGVLGVGLLNRDSGEIFTFQGARPFPMQSIFKAPLAAYALSENEAGRLPMDERITLKAMDLSPPRSAIADAWPGRADYTVRELLLAALVESSSSRTV